MQRFTMEGFFPLRTVSRKWAPVAPGFVTRISTLAPTGSALRSSDFNRSVAGAAGREGRRTRPARIPALDA